MTKDPFEERWRRRQERGRDGRPRRKRSSFAEAAKRLGLRLQRQDEISARFEGRLSGRDVTVHARATEVITWNTVVLAPGLPPAFELYAEGRLSVIKKSIVGEDILTSDERFDPLVEVGGSEIEAIAILDRLTRRQILALLPYGLRVHDRRLELTFSTERGAKEPSFTSALRAAAELANRMALDRRPVRERLLDNARHDLVAGVRLRNAALLARTGDALLPSSIDVARMLESCEPLIASGVLADSALAIIQTPAFDAAALSSLGEGALLELFERAQKDILPVLASALGERGGGAAIEALLPHTSGLFVRTSLKDAAKRAIAAIERRLEQDRGRLSIAAQPLERGALSDAPEDGGDLSITDEPSD